MSEKRHGALFLWIVLVQKEGVPQRTVQKAGEIAGLQKRSPKGRTKRKDTQSKIMQHKKAKKPVFTRDTVGCGDKVYLLYLLYLFFPINGVYVLISSFSDVDNSKNSLLCSPWKLTGRLRLHNSWYQTVGFHLAGGISLVFVKKKSQAAIKRVQTSSQRKKRLTKHTQKRNSGSVKEPGSPRAELVL